jgi:hypothetical protein
MSSKHTNIRIHPLQVILKEVFFLRAPLPYTWDNKGKLLQTVHNWVSSLFPIIKKNEFLGNPFPNRSRESGF